jgi:membrane protein implicated in regulation of membrane protease activity
MKSSFSPWAVLAALLSSAGAGLLLIATRSVSDLADAALLFGATLSALAVFAVFMALQTRVQRKAVSRHARQSQTRARRQLRTNGKPVSTTQNTEDEELQTTIQNSHQ